jgi:DNA replication protein DnaC
VEKVNRFKSVNDVYKNIVLKLVPGLAESDIEARIESDITCPQCGQNGNSGAGALYYRTSINSKWIQVGESSKCSKCRDVEAIGSYLNESLNKHRQDIINRLINDYYLMPEGLIKARFKNYEETNNITFRAKAEVIRFTKDFLDNGGKVNNLLIMGNPGTGKTHLCSATARTIRDKGFSVGFLTTIQILSKIKSTFNKQSVLNEEDIFKDLKKLDLLILDDVGSEVISGSDDWRKGMIFNIVESRSAKPTIYTSNLTDVGLPVAVGERVLSRLYNNTKFIDLFTDDYRKKLQIN